MENTDTLKIKGLKINFELEEIEINGLTTDKVAEISQSIFTLSNTVSDLKKQITELNLKKNNG